MRPLTLAALALALSPLRAAADSIDPGVHHMKKVQVIDKYGFEKPLPALTLLIPTDWKFESELVYPKGGAGCGEMFKASFRALSPDGKSGIELLPPYTWQWSDAPSSRQFMASQNQQNARFGKVGCDLMQPMRAADFLTKIVIPKVRPGAKVIGTEPLPDAHDAIQKQAQAAQAQQNQMGIRVRILADDARAHISYDLKGSPVEEWLTAVLTLRETPMPVFEGGRSRQSISSQVNARQLFALRAPAGQLEATRKLFQLIISTIRIEPEWQQRVLQVQANIAAIQQKGEADRAKIRAKSQADINQIRNESIQNQEHAQDVQHQQFSQYIRDVETYQDPNTGERVELSNQYGHAWSNGNGEYILSESPNFNPNAHLNGNWSQMEQVQPQ